VHRALVSQQREYAALSKEGMKRIPLALNKRTTKRKSASGADASLDNRNSEFLNASYGTLATPDVIFLSRKFTNFQKVP
jgi:hypothetical protein